MSRYTFLDTLTDIEARARASEAPTPSGRAKTAGSSLRELAEDLKKLGEAPAGLTYEELYAVRSGTFTLPEVPSEAPSGDTPGAPLRKLAYDLRLADRAEAAAKVAKANDILRAASGLTLLRDRLGSPT